MTAEQVDRDAIAGWREPEFVAWNDLNIAYVDARPETEAVATLLCLHGEPSWSYLYRDWIDPLVAAGVRVVTVDHLGFGFSDKPTNRAWYTFDRHVEALHHVIDALDLTGSSLVVQDWGGPIGLRVAADRPELFERIFIFNTALHHEEFVYSPALRNWVERCRDPNGFGTDMPVGKIVAKSMIRSVEEPAAIIRAFDAPYPTAESKAGAQQFPFLVPLDDNDLPGADRQADVWQQLQRWTHCPVHFVFGDADHVYPWDYALLWSNLVPGATLDAIEGAGHFVQFDAPADCVAVVLARLEADAP